MPLFIREGNRVFWCRDDQELAEAMAEVYRQERAGVYELSRIAGKRGASARRQVLECEVTFVGFDVPGAHTSRWSALPLIRMLEQVGHSRADAVRLVASGCVDVEDEEDLDD